MEVPKLQFEAMTTAMPLKITAQRRVRQVLASDPKTYGGCYHVVMYYENLNEDGYAWILAGWIKESLAIYLTEHPLLAGRLQPKGNGEMEIVSNDCGIRMVEARISSTLSNFLKSSEKDNLEHELVFWKDIDEQCPVFSPLFYVQVTNFECGGYSIGISCSLLLADFLVLDNFLKKWADIHKNVVPRNGDTKAPLFYLPRLRNPESSPTNILSRTPYKNGGQSLLFKITSEKSELGGDLARVCVHEAEKKLHRKMGPQFFLFLKESSEVIKVEKCSKDDEYSRQVLGVKNEMSATAWEEFGVYDVAFQEGNRPVHVSRWIGTAAASDGNVMVVAYPKEGVSAVIVVTLAAEMGTLK